MTWGAAEKFWYLKGVVARVCLGTTERYYLEKERGGGGGESSFFFFFKLFVIN